MEAITYALIFIGKTSSFGGKVIMMQDGFCFSGIEQPPGP